MAVPPNLSDFRKIEKELVAEQPGLSVSFIGILIAFMIGLGIRSSISSERVMDLLQAAALKIDPRVSTHIGSAQISLADGFFPELSVIVRDVTAESNEACWLRPTLEVDELKLPIDLWRLVNGEFYVHEISVNQMSLSIRSDMSQCQHNERETASVPAKSEPSQAAPSGQLWSQIAESKNWVDLIRVEKLQVHYLPMLFTSFEIRSLELNVKSQAPKNISASGILSLNGETLSGDYSSTALLNLDYVENKENPVEAHVEGNWREGHYDLKAQYRPNNQQMRIQYDMTQLPLNQLLPMLQKYKVIKGDFNGRQSWLTAKGKIDTKLSASSFLPTEIELLRLEGAIGDVETRGLHLTGANPLTFKPFDVDIKALRLDGVIDFFGGIKATPMLGKMGIFHGKLHVHDLQNFRLKGEHGGLEVIFSNRGFRQAQVLSLIEGEAAFSGDRWSIRLDHIKPADGVFLGDVALDANPNWSKVNIRSKFDELGFAPAIQKLMTDGGSVGSVAGELSARFNDGQEEDLHGNLSIADFAMQNLSLKKAKVTLNTPRKGLVAMDWRAQDIQVSEGADPYRILSVIMAPAKSEALGFQTASVQISTHQLKDLAWNNLTMQKDHTILRSSGGWKENAELYGDVQVHGKEGARKFKIQGVRDRPILIKN